MRPTVTNIRRRFQCLFFLEGMMQALTFGACLACALTLLSRARVLAGARWPLTVAAPLAVSALAGGWAKLVRAPSYAQCAALADDAAHAGGRILVRDLPGAEAWPEPPIVCPRMRFTPHWNCPAALLLLALVQFVPGRWFAAADEPSPRARPVPIAELENELDAIADAGRLDAETVEDLQEELGRIAAADDPAAPGATIEAVERLRNRVASLLEPGDDDARRLLPPDFALAGLAAADPAAAEDLRRMLADCRNGECPAGEETPGEEVEDWREEAGEESRPGAGAPERGRGDAPMQWGERAQAGDARFGDRQAKGDIRRDARDHKTGESASGEDPAGRAAADGRYGTTAIGGAASGTSAGHPVSPRHRAAVKRFFATGDNSP